MVETIPDYEFTAHLEAINVFARLLVLSQERRVLVESFA
jgi:hypothetical protein